MATFSNGEHGLPVSVAQIQGAQELQGELIRLSVGLEAVRADVHRQELAIAANTRASITGARWVAGLLIAAVLGSGWWAWDQERTTRAQHEALAEETRLAIEALRAELGTLDRRSQRIQSKVNGILKASASVSP